MTENKKVRLTRNFPTTTTTSMKNAEKREEMNGRVRLQKQN
jgi:hypothetical protein